MAVDLYETLDADWCLGPDGDLKDTSYSVNRSTWQECRERVRSSQGDWALIPDHGASISRLLGKMNNRITAEEGKTSIISSLTRNGFLPIGVITVNYIPLSNDWILYRIKIGSTMALQLLYDTAEDTSTIL